MQFEQALTKKFELFWRNTITYIVMGPAKPRKLENIAKSQEGTQMVTGGSYSNYIIDVVNYSGIEITYSYLKKSLKDF